MRACTLPSDTCVLVNQAVFARCDTDVVPRGQGRVLIKVVVGEKVEGELDAGCVHDGNVLCVRDVVSAEGDPGDKVLVKTIGINK